MYAGENKVEGHEAELKQTEPPPQSTYRWICSCGARGRIGSSKEAARGLVRHLDEAKAEQAD